MAFYISRSAVEDSYSPLIGQLLTYDELVSDATMEMRDSVILDVVWLQSWTSLENYKMGG
ncbi:hypothetical protein [Paenibacillus amylolyticus]|uniref:hypothetical protein n=1 Tax=Paenibacillus amylolyticus TaxID=1451 RepID=UPI00201E5C14|nr:hypothetical protein [Paenibacillus amylolyticus]MCL6660353.1 hypothetical protein [Paenibacillus amylolyticus]